jgi:hypothetical protein
VKNILFKFHWSRSRTLNMAAIRASPARATSAAASPRLAPVDPYATPDADELQALIKKFATEAPSRAHSDARVRRMFFHGG